MKINPENQKGYLLHITLLFCKRHLSFFTVFWLFKQKVYWYLDLQSEFKTLISDLKILPVFRKDWCVSGATFRAKPPFPRNTIFKLINFYWTYSHFGIQHISTHNIRPRPKSYVSDWPLWQTLWLEKNWSL